MLRENYEYIDGSTRMPLNAEELKKAEEVSPFLSPELNTWRDVLGRARMLSLRATHIKLTYYFRNNYFSYMLEYVFTMARAGQ